MLEGKYWKRQFDVIKAEYMKWRKFSRVKGHGGTASIDTVSVNYQQKKNPKSKCVQTPDRDFIFVYEKFFKKKVVVNVSLCMCERFKSISN